MINGTKLAQLTAFHFQLSAITGMRSYDWLHDLRVSAVVHVPTPDLLDRYSVQGCFFLLVRNIEPLTPRYMSQKTEKPLGPTTKMLAGDLWFSYGICVPTHLVDVRHPSPPRRFLPNKHVPALHSRPQGSGFDLCHANCAGSGMDLARYCTALLVSFVSCWFGAFYAEFGRSVTTVMATIENMYIRSDIGL